MRLVLLAVAASLIATPAFAHSRGGLAMLRAADANHDGSITRTEAEAARGVVFDRIDANQDGFLSATERSVAGARRGGRGGRGLEGADANHDGRISRSEMMSLPYRGFDRIDNNNDDVVSAEEIEVVRGFLHGR